MIKIIHHQYLEFIRSLNRHKSGFLNVLLAVIAVYIMLNLIVIGYYADIVIQSVYPESNIIRKFSELLLFYLVLDFFSRFLMQKIPVLSIEPYLTLPVPKKILFHYPILKSLLNFFNILGLCLVIPFFIKVVMPSSEPDFSAVWLITVLMFIYSNNFLIFTVKKKYASSPIFVFSFVVFMGVLLYVNFGEIYSLSSHFSTAMLFISHRTYWIIVPIVILLTSYRMAYKTLMNNHRQDSNAKQILKRNRRTSSFNNYGPTVELLALEIKMILRNKRPKSALLYGLLMIPYGFLLYSMNPENHLLQMLIGFFIISGVAMPYGQFVFSWQSSHFDGLMTHNIDLHSYVKSKFLLFSVLSLVAYFLSLPLVFLNEQMLLTHSVMLLYTIGISSVLILFFGCYKTKAIGLGKNQMMNYEGVSFVDFLILLPVMGIPGLMYLGFIAVDKTGYFLYGLGIFGIIGIILNRLMLSYVVRLLIKRKYKISTGFRSKQI